MVTNLVLPITSEEDLVNARQRAREVAKRLGFGAVDQSRIATAVSELTRNILRYATDRKGYLSIEELTSTPQQIGLEIVVWDEGPGIANLEEVLREGYSSGGGLGMGLPGTRRLMDEMDVESEPGRGTTITIRKWRR